MGTFQISAAKALEFGRVPEIRSSHFEVLADITGSGQTARSTLHVNRISNSTASTGGRISLGTNCLLGTLFVCLFVLTTPGMPAVVLLPQGRLSRGATQSIPELRLKKLGAALPLALQ